MNLFANMLHCKKGTKKLEILYKEFVMINDIPYMVFVLLIQNRIEPKIY